MAAKLVSSNRDTRYASEASCSAPMADDWNRTVDELGVAAVAGVKQGQG
jgi:hypothetical protein